jgi:Zn-dependent peptidase ImmA (M78 family)
MNPKNCKILGEKLAKSIIKQFGTQNVSLLCQIAKISIRYERWNPVTWGEFDRKNNTICVNLLAKIDHKEIITHELGHYFIHKEGIILSRNEEEMVVNSFTSFFTE